MKQRQNYCLPIFPVRQPSFLSFGRSASTTFFLRHNIHYPCIPSTISKLLVRCTHHNPGSASSLNKSSRALPPHATKHDRPAASLQTLPFQPVQAIRLTMKTILFMISSAFIISCVIQRKVSNSPIVAGGC